MNNKNFKIFVIVLTVLSLYIFGLMGINKKSNVNNTKVYASKFEYCHQKYSTPILYELTEEVNNKKITKEETKEEYIVTASALNIREGASINSNIIGIYHNNEKVNVIEKNGVWYKTDKGYCHSKYLTLTTEEVNNKKITKEEEYIVTASALNIREGASINSNIIGIYHNNEKVNVIEKNGVWYKTDKGYCHSKYLTLTTEEVNNVKNNLEVQNTGKNIYAPKSIYDSILIKSNLTAEQIELILNGNELSGIGQAIVDIENLYGINCFVTLAVARLESGNGTSKIARGKKNLFGLCAYDSNPYYHALSFTTKEDSVYKFGQILNDTYISNKRTTLKSINEIYATSQLWAKKVFNIIQSDFKKYNNLNNGT